MKIKKAVSILTLAMCMVLTHMPVFAADETQTITSGSANATVKVIKTSSCTVMIPKTVTLSVSGSNYAGSYSTKLTAADLDNGTKVKVSSGSTCTLTNAKDSTKSITINNDMDSSTTQAETYVYYTDTTTTKNGSLKSTEAATSVKAGTYSGTLSFSVAIETSNGSV